MGIRTMELRSSLDTLLWQSFNIEPVKRSLNTLRQNFVKATYRYPLQVRVRYRHLPIKRLQ